MKIVKLCLKNSLMLNLLTLFVIVLGVVCSSNIKREAFPSVDYDYVTIQTVYPGADPNSVEEYVTNLIEDELKKIDGIEEFRSRSKESFSSVFVKLEPDQSEYQKAQTVNEIQRAIDRIRDFPKEIKEQPIVKEIKSGSMPIMQAVLSGDMPYHQLHTIADELTDIIENLPDASNPRKYGFYEQEYWIEVDPEKTKSYHLTLDQVVSSLAHENVDLPGGAIRTDEGEYLLRTVSKMKTIEDIKNIVLRRNDSGVEIKVKDIGKTSVQFEKNNIVYRASGTTAISLIIRKSKSGDIISLVEDVKKIIADYKTNHGLDSLKVSYINDFSVFVKNRLGILLNNGVLGIVLVLIALLLLLSRGIALVAVVGIPVAFLGAMIFMYLFGITINLLTMFALILVLGMLVDDAIIVAENIWQYYEQGFSPWDATVEGTKEVFWPVTVTIMTTIAAFSPMLLVSGIFGKYISIFPKVVIITLLISLLEAMLILPSHAYEMMKFVSTRKKRAMSSRRKKINGFLSKILLQYQKLLEAVLRTRYLFAAFLVALLFGSLWFSQKKMKTVLFPSEGVEIFYLRATYPQGTSLEETSNHTVFFEELVKDKVASRELIDFVTLVGIHQQNVMDPIRTEANHLSQIGIFLTPENERSRSAEDIIASLREEITKHSSEHKATKVTFKKMSPGPPVGKPVAIRILGRDLERMQEVANNIEHKLSQLEGIKDIESDYIIGKKELKIIIDSQKASQALLSPREVGRAVRSRVEGEIATYIYNNGERIPLRVRYKEGHERSHDILQHTYIRNARDLMIPLSSIADTQELAGINAIKHFDGQRLITISANIDDKITSSTLVNQKIIPDLNLLEKKYAGINLNPGGEYEDTQKSLNDLKYAFLVALALIYIIIVALFGSLTQPLIIMCAIPFGLIGVVFAFYLHSFPLSFLGMLGTIGLTGVVVNDSILMVDFINKGIAKGMALKDAIINGARRRFRAVCLTSITTISGILPLVYGFGGEDKFLRPAAVALGYGLLFSTVLILLFVPVIYCIREDIIYYFKRRAQAARRR